MPGQMLTAEMSPREGALAAQWLGLETVLPCHYIDPDRPEVREFGQHLADAKGQGMKKCRRLSCSKPGDWLDMG